MHEHLHLYRYLQGCIYESIIFKDECIQVCHYLPNFYIFFVFLNSILTLRDDDSLLASADLTIFSLFVARSLSHSCYRCCCCLFWAYRLAVDVQLLKINIQSQS